ncbi:hypothetical protein CAEBREN_12099 [Caenorhabditis brenneri]|uniref:Uncharacterized protein n=1 Tax=Caenorhabditis brenneri TaxID=135651 RepID=G0NGJ6_CAEBE|nr:hypothetical protein CAEBREN_12099 [Caenorhabditis brenneri]
MVDIMEEEKEERRGADGTEAEQEGILRSRRGATDTEETIIDMMIEEDTGITLPVVNSICPNIWRTTMAMTRSSEGQKATTAIMMARTHIGCGEDREADSKVAKEEEEDEDEKTEKKLKAVRRLIRCYEKTLPKLRELRRDMIEAGQETQKLEEVEESIRDSENTFEALRELELVTLGEFQGRRPMRARLSTPPLSLQLLQPHCQQHQDHSADA